MNSLYLNENNLTELTEENLILLCQLNNIKPEKLTQLDLSWNELTDLNCFNINTVFNNIKELYIGGSNKIKDINNIKYLENLIYLNLKDEKETIELFKTMPKLKGISCYKTFKTYTEEQLEKELLGIIK